MHNISLLTSKLLGKKMASPSSQEFYANLRQVPDRVDLKCRAEFWAERGGSKLLARTQILSFWAKGKRRVIEEDTKSRKKIHFTYT